MVTGFSPEPEYVSELKRCLGSSDRAPFEYYRALLRPRLALLRGARSRIETPTLYLHGANDGCVDVRMMAGQRRQFGGHFEAKVLPDVCHFMQLERPDAVAVK